VFVFSSDLSGDSRLWRIGASGGAPEKLLGIGGPDFAERVSVKRHRLVFTRGTSDENIWRIAVQGSAIEGRPKKLIASTRDDMNPQPSPDGKRLAFCSNRSGSLEI